MVQIFMKRTPLQVFSTGVDRSGFRACAAASGMGNISLVDGRMDSIKYEKILEANITQSIKNCR